MNSTPRKRNRQLLRHRIWDQPGTLKPKRSAAEQLSPRLLQRARCINDSMSKQSEPGIEKSVEKRLSMRNEAGVQPQPEPPKTNQNHPNLHIRRPSDAIRIYFFSMSLMRNPGPGHGSRGGLSAGPLQVTSSPIKEPLAPSCHRRCKVTADPKLQELIIKGEELVQRGQEREQI